MGAFEKVVERLENGENPIVPNTTKEFGTEGFRGMPSTETMTLSDVMKETGLTRKMATRLLNDPSAPTLPRVKNSPFLVPRQAFWNWYRNAQWKE